MGIEEEMGVSREFSGVFLGSLHQEDVPLLSSPDGHPYTREQVPPDEQDPQQRHEA